MWFTRVSIANPVLATMVMLALVVLGLFSFQRLKVDQFPDIEFPTVVVSTEYPGAAAEIVETELTRKIEESVNAIAGISQLSSRSYAGTSVVIIQFDLTMDGRRAADDVREKLAILKPQLREEIGEPKVQRFDPASRPIWSVAVRASGDAPPDAADAADAAGAMRRTLWAEQVLKKRLENVRGVGSVTLVGAVRREIQIQLDPVRMEAAGISAEQVIAAVRGENQDLPAGLLRSAEQERVVQIRGRIERPEDFAGLVVARRGATLVRLGEVAQVVDGPQEIGRAHV